MSRRALRNLHRAATFGARVRAARQEVGLTQERLARELDVTLRTIQRWEDGTSEPRGTQLMALAQCLSVSASDLYPQPEAA